MNSWEKSDSKFYPTSRDHLTPAWNDCVQALERPYIGPEDMSLACRLIKGGSEHRKFLRQIMVWMDITIPRYCWQELDTYKVATVRNSCSTMHKLGNRLLTQEDFEQPLTPKTLRDLNDLVVVFQTVKENPVHEVRLREIRRRLKNDLPEGYLQRATYSMSYETALSIIKQRHNHRLDEWHWLVPGSICWFLLTLPYMREFATALLGDKLVGVPGE
jgi:hypothetical protein